MGFLKPNVDQPVTPMTVADLIEFLGKQPQDLPVVYPLHSEYCLM